MGYENESIMDPEAAEDFTCTICFEIAEDPQKCNICSKLFCEFCIEEWQKIQSKCPFKCSDDPIKVNSLVNEELIQYNNIQIKCSKKCGAHMSLGVLNAHMAVCGLGKCFNHVKCSKNAKFLIRGNKTCSEFCVEFCEMKKADVRDKKKILELIHMYKLFKNHMRVRFNDQRSGEMPRGYLIDKK